MIVAECDFNNSVRHVDLVIFMLDIEITAIGT